MNNITTAISLLIFALVSIYSCKVYLQTMTDIILLHFNPNLVSHHTKKQGKDFHPPALIKTIKFVNFIAGLFQTALVLVIILFADSYIPEMFLLPLVGLLFLIPSGIYHISIRYPIRHGLWTSLISLFLVFGYLVISALVFIFADFLLKALAS